jgi:hypothetical protein
VLSALPVRPSLGFCSSAPRIEGHRSPTTRCVEKGIFLLKESLYRMFCSDTGRHRFRPGIGRTTSESVCRRQWCCSCQCCHKRASPSLAYEIPQRLRRLSCQCSMHRRLKHGEEGDARRGVCSSGSPGPVAPALVLLVPAVSVPKRQFSWLCRYGLLLTACTSAFRVVRCVGAYAWRLRSGS